MTDDPARHEVPYACSRCGLSFILVQYDPEPDEDITLCWDCIDALLDGPAGL